MSAAAMIQKGVDRDLYAVALEPEERDAILAVLEDPPTRARKPSCQCSPEQERGQDCVSFLGFERDRVQVAVDAFSESSLRLTLLRGCVCETGWRRCGARSRR